MLKSFILGCGILVLTIGVAHSAPLYRITDLGNMPDGGVLNPNDINNRGQIIASASHSNGTDGFSYIWENGSITDIGALPGQLSRTTGYGINDLGQVTGLASGPLGTVAFFWNSGVMTAMPYLGGIPNSGDISVGYKINDLGQIVGYSRVGEFQATQWDGNAPSVTALPSIPIQPPLRISLANDINENGIAVGSSRRDVPRAVKWINGTISELDLLGDPDQLSQAVAINDSDIIAGHSETDDGDRATLWDANGPQNLGTISADTYRTASTDINNNNQVVGIASRPNNQHFGFLWSDDDGMLALDDLIDPLDPLFAIVRIELAIAINDNGWIIAKGDNFAPNNDHNRGYLLTPISVPEPASFILIIGLISLAGVRRYT